MSSTLELLSDIAPNICSNCSLDKKNRFISIAKKQIDQSLFGENDTYDLAVAYYTAHLLTLSLRDDNSRGNLTMEKEGDLQKSYNNSNGEINTTQYYDNYSRLIKARIPIFFI